MTTLRQVQATRINSHWSTGPRTEAGRRRSARNGLTHGLAGEGTDLPESERGEFARRLDEWREVFRPRDAVEALLVERAVTETIRLDLCRREEELLRALEARRAELCWDDDRFLEAEQRLERLAKAPARVVRQVRRTLQGFECLRRRWEALADALDGPGGWDEAQGSLALDLLGVPPELRVGPTPIDPAPGGDPREVRRALVRAELERLEENGPTMEALDRDERTVAVLGLPAVQSRAMTLIRRYESAAMRRLTWALERLGGHPDRLAEGPDFNAPATFAPALDVAPSIPPEPEPPAWQDRPAAPESSAPEPASPEPVAVPDTDLEASAARIEALWPSRDADPLLPSPGLRPGTMAGSLRNRLLATRPSPTRAARRAAGR